MKPRFLLAFLIIILPGLISYGQKTAVIRNVDFSLVENKLVITYEISNYRANDKFNIKIEIFKASGEKIDAKSLYGDVGEIDKVEGNTIIWDLEKDNITLDDDIYVIVSGDVLSAPDKQQIMEIPEKTTISPGLIQKPSKNVSRTACFFESLLFPGWGTSRLTNNNLHFIKGFLGYGALIGSIYMAMGAIDSYNDYKLSANSVERDKYFNEATSRNSLSKIFAGTAAAVWTVDLISVLAVKNKNAPRASTDIYYHIGYSSFLGNNQLTCKIIF